VRFAQFAVPTAYLEKGEPLLERSPQHSASTKDLGLCASRPGEPFFLRTALASLFHTGGLRDTGRSQVRRRSGGSYVRFFEQVGKSVDGEVEPRVFED
jgi:hypothetical protein